MDENPHHNQQHKKADDGRVPEQRGSLPRHYRDVRCHRNVGHDRTLHGEDEKEENKYYFTN